MAGEGEWEDKGSDFLMMITKPPVFDVWNIVADKEAITIEYKYSVSQQSPRVSNEEWTKNGEY